jgi:hypothetical protein
MPSRTASLGRPHETRGLILRGGLEKERAKSGTQGDPVNCHRGASTGSPHEAHASPPERNRNLTTKVIRGSQAESLLQGQLLAVPVGDPVGAPASLLVVAPRTSTVLADLHMVRSEHPPTPYSGCKKQLRPRSRMSQEATGVPDKPNTAQCNRKTRREGQVVFDWGSESRALLGVGVGPSNSSCSGMRFDKNCA